MGDPEDPSYEEGEVSAPSMAAPEKVAAHLARVAGVVLEDEDGGQNALFQVLGQKKNLDTVAKFCSDPHCKTLLVERFAGAKDDQDDEDSAGAGGAGGTGGAPQATAQAAGQESHLFSVSVNVHFSNPRVASVVFVKKSSLVEAEKSIGAQLRVISLSDGSPYETLHSYVSSAVAPYFKSFVRESGKADRDGDKMATSMEKKIAELEMGLLHLQQNIDIPEISLTVHPLILQVCSRIAIM